MCMIGVGSPQELTGPEWESPSGVLAQIILLDQVSRGAFRRAKEVHIALPGASMNRHRSFALAMALASLQLAGG